MKCEIKINESTMDGFVIRRYIVPPTKDKYIPITVGEGYQCLTYVDGGHEVVQPNCTRSYLVKGLTAIGVIGTKPIALKVASNPFRYFEKDTGASDENAMVRFDIRFSVRDPKKLYEKIVKDAKPDDLDEFLRPDLRARLAIVCGKALTGVPYKKLGDAPHKIRKDAESDLYVFFDNYGLNLIGVEASSPVFSEEFRTRYLNKVDAAKAAERPTVCPECGADLPIDANFCPKCGHKI